MLIIFFCDLNFLTGIKFRENFYSRVFNCAIFFNNREKHKIKRPAKINTNKVDLAFHLTEKLVIIDYCTATWNSGVLFLSTVYFN